MKEIKILFFILILFSLPLTVLSVNSNRKEEVDSNKILGQWQVKNSLLAGNTVIEFFKEDDKYFADIVKLQDMYKYDSNNPMRSGRGKRLYGAVIIKDLVYDGDDKWNKGTIYMPKEGKTYSCEVYLDNSYTLKVRGEILRGKSVTFILEKVK